ncbi:hypothetical protein LSM04_000721 [Trypanosoma melophagium]|uniref:uncharacterized protein n=1 Tax=Trypanosoma melophagium TaxID=715481 RepID=UPI00351A07BA|nr:hypothetical protein LSM04_000721 [Trypanosoma melophagium]
MTVSVLLSTAGSVLPARLRQWKESPAQFAMPPDQHCASPGSTHRIVSGEETPERKTENTETMRPERTRVVQTAGVQFAHGARAEKRPVEKAANNTKKVRRTAARRELPAFPHRSGRTGPLPLIKAADTEGKCVLDLRNLLPHDL